MRRYVLGFLVSPNLEHVLLIKKARPDWQSGLLNGVGGNVEAGEFLNPKLAMVREFGEETPWPSNPAEWIHYADMDRRGDWLVHVFFARWKNLTHPNVQERLDAWNAVPERDEPLYIVRVADLLPAVSCISNLPGLIGFIQDYNHSRPPLEIRY
jgi:8-oxo-dGTP pyrophosphatase MutT (NUDIX family)